MPLVRNGKSEKGQILLIVVLASVISLTVGLAAISRSITNTRISTEEANSQKALAAAEAGVEEQLNKANIQNPSGNVTLSNSSIYSATADPLDGSVIPINNGLPVSQDDGADIWLSDYPDFNNPKSPRLTLYWKDNPASGCTDDAAIEIAVIYGGNKTTPSMSRYAVDPCGDTSRRASNHFDAPNGGGGTISINGVPFAYNHSHTFPPAGVINQGYIARVIPLYATTSMAVRAVDGSNNPLGLPAQGYVVNSTGTSGTTVRKVRVFQGFPRLPVEFFPYNLFLP